MPKISIIIPNYNCEKYIEKSITSVISQTLKDIEIIIIDDGSSDNSTKIIKDLAKKDDRIIFIEQPNMNASVARNAGIKIASGEYIFFLDSDDFLFNDYVLEKIYEDVKGYDLLIGNYIEIDSQNKVLKQYNCKKDFINEEGFLKYIKVSPPPSNKLYKLKIIKDNNIYFSNVRIAQDLNFYLKYIVKCKNVVTVDYNIYNYRVLNGSMTRANNLNFLDIVYSFNEVKKYYDRELIDFKHYRYIYNLEFRHYSQQINKIFYIKDKQVRKIVYYYINYAINKIDLKNTIIDKEFKKRYLKIKILQVFHNIFLSNFFIRIYSFFKKDRLKEDSIGKIKEKFYNKIVNSIVSIAGVFSIKMSSKLLYFFDKKEKLNLKQPTKFNEKLMWLKIYNYNNNRIVWKCSDKYTMREYAISKGISEENLTTLLGVFNNANEIDFSELPQKFVLKCTHGSGFNIICKDKNDIDTKAVKRKLNRWLKTRFGKDSAENHYNHIKPKIICEEYIESKDGDLMPNDYKIYCFNGEPKVILVCTKRNTNYHEAIFYNLKWEKLHLRNDVNDYDVIKPKTIDKMIKMSKLLSSDFPFVRVDFYELDGKPILGELTFTPAACLAEYTDEGDKYLSDMLKINI